GRRLAADHAAVGAQRGRVHRVRHRRVSPNRARAQSGARGRPAEGVAFFHRLRDHPPRDPTVMQPGSGQRPGFGAWVLVQRVGARIYAELAGYGMAADAYHITAPSEDGDGPLRVMGRALKSACIEPAQVSYINAHGTSTPHGDKVETIAIKRCFGEHAATVPV